MAISQDGWFNDTLIKALSNDIALDLSNTTPGAFKAALFQSTLTPDFSASSPAYGVAPYDDDEAAGPGYTAGGLDVTVTSFGEAAAANKVGWALEELSWTGATIEAAGLLIYVPSLSDTAVLLRAFGQSYAAEDGEYSVAFAADGVWRTVLRTSA